MAKARPTESTDGATVQLRRLQDGFVTPPISQEEADGLLACYEGDFEVVTPVAQRLAAVDPALDPEP